MPKLLVIDNYDSFTYNLVQMFRRHDLTIRVCRADKVTLEEMDAWKPDYLVISPGPKDPQHSGVSVPAVRHFIGAIPILGVCLGMQALNEAFGGQTVRAALPVHGKTSAVYHRGSHLFRGIPSPFRAMRYHSLLTSGPAASLHITATTSDGLLMGVSHHRYPVHGLQFHPDSFMTEWGDRMIHNFLKP